MDFRKNVENMIWTEVVKNHYQHLLVVAYLGFAIRKLS
jgi:hypothetical protein